MGRERVGRVFRRGGRQRRKSDEPAGPLMGTRSTLVSVSLFLLPRFLCSRVPLKCKGDWICAIDIPRPGPLSTHFHVRIGASAIVCACACVLRFARTSVVGVTGFGTTGLGFDSQRGIRMPLYCFLWFYFVISRAACFGELRCCTLCGAGGGRLLGQHRGADTVSEPAQPGQPLWPGLGAAVHPQSDLRPRGICQHVRVLHALRAAH